MRETLESHERELSDTQKKDKIKNPWKYTYPEYDQIPSGNLQIKMETSWRYSKRGVWNDGAEQKLENCLNSFLIAAINFASYRRNEALEDERQRLIREEEARVHAENERRRLEREKKIRRLAGEVHAWSRANRIRAYLADLRQRSAPESALQEWIAWASAYADHIDPIITLTKTP